MSDDSLLNYKQAAAYLNIGKSTIYALVSQGELTCAQFGAGKTKKGITWFQGRRPVRLHDGTAVRKLSVKVIPNNHELAATEESVQEAWIADVIF